MKKVTMLIALLILISSTMGAAFSQQIVATQKGPIKAHKGEYITIQYTIINNGAETVYDASINSQNLDEYLGTLNPGDRRTFKSRFYIPTDEEVKQDFGPDATVSNPFFIGGFAVIYKDANGEEHTVNSNSLEIPLVRDGSQDGNASADSTTQDNADKSLWDMILEFFNSIVQFIKGLF